MNAAVPPDAAGGGPPPVPYWFFTGYSDDRSMFPLVERFHNDVQKQVKQMLGNAVPGKGFVDFQDIRPGERWEERVVANGVCTARAMLALYSPSYFQSHWCAHEWTVFNARLSRRANLIDSPFLIGVLWQRIGLKLPEPSTAYQYVRLGAGTMYEQRGLVSIVPRDQGPVHQEYEDVVHEVARLLVEAHFAALAPIRVEDIATLRPQFGAESSLPVDYVLAYTDRDRDRGWGKWAYSQLHPGHDVDVLPAECFGRAPARLLRSSLLRAKRVVLLLSRDSLTDRCLNRTVLEEIYADPDLEPDLPRLVPVFIDHVPPEEVPAGLTPQDVAALYDIPDPLSQREILLTAVNAPVTAPAVARKAPPAFPSNAVSSFESRLVDKLSVASSLIDGDIRTIWFEATGFDTAEEPKSNLPTRPWLLAVVRIARKRPDGYERLARALEAIDSESPESIEVRKLVDGHTP
ncbi:MULTISPECIES: TIR domain-containing protein [unclassified Streptomyces]|uniref:TIR domain-containing protein n=1 Tax=unclassified Streptomyces TaxID=2593676 RepID=UPI002365055B|nr:MULTISPECIES: TIR domain-containing protein [unclassified Streptomyces]MDF3144272.1 TIR domain-containing protein [Streptomyces sp. T21Q-yed]WDF37205.1 TIR domain-containing protein [Streptomyces sp. T12]